MAYALVVTGINNRTDELLYTKVLVVTEDYETFQDYVDDEIEIHQATFEYLGRIDGAFGDATEMFTSPTVDVLLTICKTKIV